MNQRSFTPETMGIPAAAAMERGVVIQEITATVTEIPEIMGMATGTLVITAMATVTGTTRKTARVKAQTTQATATPPMRKSITARTRAASCSR